MVKVLKWMPVALAALLFSGFLISGFHTPALAEVVSVGASGGEKCENVVPNDIGYRASLFECNGNAAILFRNNFRNVYSVVLRRNGAGNDRDPHNLGCSSARCSPYKVQKRIELPDQEVNCLGETGFGPNLALANRISIKFTAKITNAADPSQFRQYCLPDTTKSVH
jgi:hypothetical protein